MIKIYLLQSNILWDFIDIILLSFHSSHWKFIHSSDNLEFTFWIYKLDYAKKWENNLKKSTQVSVEGFPLRMWHFLHLCFLFSLLMKLMFDFYALFHKYICLIASENSLQWVFTLKHNWYKSSPSNTLGLFAKKVLLYFCLNWYLHAVMASWIFCHLFTFYNLKGFTWIWKHIHFSMYFFFRSLKRLNNVLSLNFPSLTFLCSEKYLFLSTFQI